jgi:hypothetical protein
MADMDTGWSLSSGRPEAGPVGRYDEEEIHWFWCE